MSSTTLPTMTSTAHSESDQPATPLPAAAATPVSRPLRRAQIIHEIMEARYLRAVDQGSSAEIARAEVHLVNAVRRCQEAARQPDIHGA